MISEISDGDKSLYVSKLADRMKAHGFAATKTHQPGNIGDMP